MEQIFDDGSTLTFDNAGYVISATTSDGDPLAMPGPAGSGVVQQFANLFNYGIRSAIDARFRPSAQAAPGTAQAAAVPSAATLRTVLLVAVAAVLAIKFLK